MQEWKVCVHAGIGGTHACRKWGVTKEGGKMRCLQEVGRRLAVLALEDGDGALFLF